MKVLCFVILLVCLGVPMQVYANQGSLYNRVIILDAGHGLRSPGGVVLEAGYIEHERMFVLAEFLRDELVSRGATVHMTRKCYNDVPLPVRPALMNLFSLEALLDDRLSRLSGIPMLPGERRSLMEEIKRLQTSLYLLNKIIHDHENYAPIYLNFPFDYTFQRQIHPSWQQILEFQSDPLIRYNWLAISLHSNAESSTLANGVDVFFSANNNPRNRQYFDGYSHEDNTELFGRMLLERIAPLGLRPNSVSVRHFMVIRETNVPAVLVENGYHTNYHNRRLLLDDGFMQRLAVAYANTIEAYFAQINQNEVSNFESIPILRELNFLFSRGVADRLRTMLLTIRDRRFTHSP